MNFNENLKNELKWRGITQVELAKALNIPKTTVNGWIKNRGYPNLKQFYQLCYVLRLSADELLGIEFH